MVLTPDPPFPKSQGDNIRSKDWNDAVNEVRRLDTDKLDKLGGRITGPLNVDGRIGVGTTNPDRNLTVEGTGGTFLNARDASGGGPFEVLVGADTNGGILSTMSNHDLQLRAGVNSTKLVIKADGKVGIGTLAPNANLEVAGSLRVTGDLEIPTTTAGVFAAFSTLPVLAGENASRNVKLRMGSTGFIVLGTPLRYEFSVGHTVFGGIIGGAFSTTFIKSFSVNQNGDAHFAGSKGGYIIDFFLNGVGDTLEQGDVVVLSQSEPVHYYGFNSNIPIPEVNLTDQPYDKRVCGIVANFVSAQDLPSVLPKSDATEEEFMTHPLLAFAGDEETEQAITEVKQQQLGRMVTLGAWAHCKVDADIEPIEAGDLLTTSPTKGHAQKVGKIKNQQSIVGTIIGKALAPLAKGKGKIPIMVMLQ
jgi:hypothetical protein